MDLHHHTKQAVMLKLLECGVDALIHGAIKGAILVIPFQISACALLGVHVNLHVVFEAETIPQVFEIFNALVFDGFQTQVAHDWLFFGRVDRHFGVFDLFSCAGTRRVLHRPRAKLAQPIPPLRRTLFHRPTILMHSTL